MIANKENMKEIFDLCNTGYFIGELEYPQFNLLHSFRTCGYFEFTKGGWFDKNIYDPVISITDYYDFTIFQFIELMCHEMIHYYLACSGKDRRGRHGKEFKKMAKAINETHNLNITKYVDISKYKRRKGTPVISYWLSQII